MSDEKLLYERVQVINRKKLLFNCHSIVVNCLFLDDLIQAVPTINEYSVGRIT